MKEREKRSRGGRSYGWWRVGGREAKREGGKE